MSSNMAQSRFPRRCASKHIGTGGAPPYLQPNRIRRVGAELAGEVMNPPGGAWLSTHNWIIHVI
jgi:hypothetical protein